MTFFNYSGVNIEERIDIHTQTAKKPYSANPYMTKGGAGVGDDEIEAESVNEPLEDEEELEYKNHDLVDTEWKTQSLPSLGRVSSEQTLESSGDEFAALRRTAPTRMLKSRQIKYQKTDEEELLEDVGDSQTAEYENTGHHAGHHAGHYEEEEPVTVASEPPYAEHTYDQQPKQVTKRPMVRERDVERGEEMVQQRRPPAAVGRTSSRNFDRYSYAGYEPEREFKDYAREREMMLRRGRQAIMQGTVKPLNCRAKIQI